MKSDVCYLFLCTNGFNKSELWCDYFSHSNIVIHNKTNTEGIPTVFHKFCINPNPTEWGTISLVNATLYLIKIGLEWYPNCTHFVLLCGASVPLQNRIVCEEIIRSQSHSCFSEIKVEKSKRIPKKYSKHSSKMSQWFIMTKNDAIWYTNHKDIKTFENVFAPDETYFICLAKFNKRHYLNKNFMYVKWDLIFKYHPLNKKYYNFRSPNEYKEITEEMKQSNCLFARKLI